MKLLDAQKGRHYRVISIELNEAEKRRFEILGMTRGTDIEILYQKPSGSKIVRLRGTRFAIGKSFAEGITVEPTEGAC